MYKNKLRFESDQHIAEFRQPVLILHAEDDLVVPFELGYKVSVMGASRPHQHGWCSSTAFFYSPPSPSFTAKR